MLLWMKMREIRNQNNLTQQQLSDKMNLERSTYANYENGSRRVPYGVLKRFAYALNITTDSVLSGVDDTENEKTENNDEWKEIKDKLHNQLKTIKDQIKELQKQENQIQNAIEVIDKIAK